MFQQQTRNRNLYRLWRLRKKSLAVARILRKIAKYDNAFGALYNLYGQDPLFFRIEINSVLYAFAERKNAYLSAKQAERDALLKEIRESRLGKQILRQQAKA